MATYRAQSWHDLTERLYADSWQPALGRFRSRYAFRGMEDASADLSTSLSRLRGPFARQEGHLLRNFRKYAHRDAVPGDSIWNWLSLAQHHGLPTRLLDWTYSPFVALHFATNNIENFHLDGIISCIDYGAAHRLLPARLRRILRNESADVFTAEMLDRGAQDLPALDRLTPGKSPFVLFLEPPSLDDRIVNQFALFSLMSSHTAQMDAWIRKHRALAHKIIIPANLKWEIRDKLDQANVTERVLFPGLDGLSRWLRRYYSPTRTSSGPAGRPGVRPEDAPLAISLRPSARGTAGAGNGTSGAPSGGRAASRRSSRSDRKARGT